MEHYPDPRKLKEISIVRGPSVADQMLQEAMIKSGLRKVEQNMQNLEDSGNYAVTGYGSSWISDNLIHLADKILMTPNTEIVQGFIDFPRKFEGISASEYLSNISAYKSKGIKITKDPSDQRQKEINDFVWGCINAQQRSRTVALITLSRILEAAMGIRRNKSDIDDIDTKVSSESLSGVAGRIMEEVTCQLIEQHKNELRKVAGTVSLRNLQNRFIIKSTGKPTNKGNKIAKILNIKNIRSIDNENLVSAGHSVFLLVDQYLDDILIFNGEIIIVKEVMDELLKSRSDILENACELRPTLEVPVSDGKHVSYREYPLRKNLLDNCTDDLPYLSEIDAGAVQRIQGVPFKINKPYLEAVKKVMDAGLFIKKKMNLPVPEKLKPLEDFPVFSRSVTKKQFLADKEEWFQDPQNKIRYKDWKDLEEKRNKSISKAISINDMNRMTIEIAQWYADYGGSFYLPIYMDYRTRCYYCPTILNPQASKLAKSMFVAARAEEITEEGMDYWLVNLAGSMKTVQDENGAEYTGDKSPWNVAKYAAKRELEQAAKCALDPIGEFDHWSNQDDPFGYLAQSFEAQGVIDKGPEALSKIFINMDGSCNGYQHAAAYLQDASTGRLVNMTNYSDDLPPEDLYGEVSRSMITNAKLNRSKVDQKLLNNDFINRDSVKRITMCIGYSLTEKGALAYSDEEVLKLTDEDTGINPLYKTPEGLQEVSNHFRDGIFGTIVKVAPAIFRTRDVVREVGFLVCEFGNGKVLMETLTGSKISFTKHSVSKKRVALIKNGKRMRFTVKRMEKNKIEAKEVANASSPNFTHLNDATHLRLLALGMPVEAPMMFIHDSFSTIAKYAPKMAKLTRSTFRKMYEKEHVIYDFVLLNLKNIALKYSIDLDEFLKRDKDMDYKDLKGAKRKFVKSLNKIRRNINQTKDLDWDLLEQNRNFFR